MGRFFCVNYLESSSRRVKNLNPPVKEIQIKIYLYTLKTKFNGKKTRF